MLRSGVNTAWQLCCIIFKWWHLNFLRWISKRRTARWQCHVRKNNVNFFCALKIRTASHTYSFGKKVKFTSSIVLIDGLVTDQVTIYEWRVTVHLIIIEFSRHRRIELPLKELYITTTALKLSLFVSARNLPPLPMKLASLFSALFVLSTLFCSAASWRRRRRRRCYRNCTPESWAGKQWSSCSKSCGTGTQFRTRGIATPAICGGTCNVVLRETRLCNTHCCPVSCQWSWNAWSLCRGCGISTQTRSLRVTRYPSCGGAACPGTQTRSCNTGV